MDGPNIEELKETLLQRKSDVILWGEPSVSGLDEKIGYFFTGWCDLYVPDLQDALQMSWVWTIDSDVDDEKADLGLSTIPQEDDIWYIRLPYDLDVYSVWDPACKYIDSDKKEQSHAWYGLSLPVVKGETLRKEQQEQLDNYLQKEGTSLSILGGWSEKLINQTIEKWCLKYSGRVFEVKYEVDQKLSGGMEGLEEILSNMKEDPEKNSYQIGETSNGTKIMASGQVMDFLLAADFEAAGKIVEALKKATEE